MSDESFIKSVLDNIQCPICYVAMIPPSHTPMIITECGHTFCQQCIATMHQCPLCKKEFTNTIKNILILQIADSANQKHIIPPDMDPNQEIDEPKPSIEPVATKPPPKNEPDIEGLIDLLTEYNPDRQICREALEANDNDIEKASKYLLFQIVDDHPPPNNDLGPVIGLTDEEIEKVLKEKPEEMSEEFALELFIQCDKNIEMFKSLIQ